MIFIQNNFANALTLGNLFLGCIGSIQLILGNYKTTALCLIGSLMLDFLDGFIARTLKANNNLGKQLDSLADMISFGFLPGLTMYKALENFGNIAFGINFIFDIKYIGLLITIFSCLRLAIFNLDEDQKYYFKGLNTPSNTILIFGIYYELQEKNNFFFLFNNAEILLILCILCSWLLISRIKMISMKFKSMKIQDNYLKIVLLIGCIISLSVFGITSIPLCIVYYIIISLFFQKKLV